MLVAVSVTDCGVVGAVRTPFAEILPAEAPQVTALEKLPVPVTVAVQLDVAPVSTGVWHRTVTDVIVGWLGAAATVTSAPPCLVESCVLVAITVTVCGADGDVKIPLEEILPPEAFHVTAVLKLPVPLTDAAHALVWPVWIELGVQVTVTEVIEGEGEGEGADGVGLTLPFDMADPPPHPATSSATTRKTTQRGPHQRIERSRLISPPRKGTVADVTGSSQLQ
jgi:hypothetical protein